MPDFTFFAQPFDLTMQRRTDRDTATRRNDVQFAVDDLVDALSYIRSELRTANESAHWIADALDALKDALPAIAKALNRERDEARLADPVEPFETRGVDKLIKSAEWP